MVDLPKNDEGHEAREAATRATRARGRAVPTAVRDRAIVVAPDGDDAAPGTQEAPIATLHEAQRRLRELPGGTVVLTDGVWRLDRPLRLTARDSGEPGAPRRWTAAPGAHPVISGGVPVSGWTCTTSRSVSTVPGFPGSPTRVRSRSTVAWPNARGCRSIVTR